MTDDAVNSQDVTEEFVDLEYRERNLLTAGRRLLKLYDEAGDVNDALSIQRELTNVRPVRRDETPPEPGWSSIAVAARAWDVSLGVLQTLAAAVISIAVFSWWLTPRDPG